jgi:hypothetical protein
MKTQLINLAEGKASWRNKNHQRKLVDFYNLQKGQAALVMIFILGMASLILSLSFSSTGITNMQISSNSYSAKKAFYAAQTGVEDLLIRLKQNQTLGDPSPIQTSNNLDQAYYIATISAPSGQERIITAQGNYRNFTKKIRVVLNSSSEQTSFNAAVQTGGGGFELEENSKITCKAPCTQGKVYSNGDILGIKKSPKSSASRIVGAVYAHGVISGLGSGTGVWVDKDASAAALLKCTVEGDQASLASGPVSGCPLASGKIYRQLSEAPPALPLPSFNTDFWKYQATNSAIGGSTFTGNCDVKSGTSTDCTNGTGLLGPRKIIGNLIINAGKNLTVTGPIWVTGNINIANNNTIILDPNFINYGTVVLADGNIATDANVDFTKNGSAVIMMTSLKDDGQNCSTPAISVANNTTDVVFYALYGCVRISNNALFDGSVVGQKVHVGGNSTIEYDPALAQAVFGSSCVGGWAITDWQEID